MKAIQTKPHKLLGKMRLECSANSKDFGKFTGMIPFHMLANDLMPFDLLQQVLSVVTQRDTNLI